MIEKLTASLFSIFILTGLLLAASTFLFLITGNGLREIRIFLTVFTCFGITNCILLAVIRRKIK